MHRSKVSFESLESRNLFSASLDSITVTPAITVTAAASSSTTAGITPALIKSAYGIDDISFSGVSGTGAGQTIAIVDAYNDPNIASDLATFSTAYGLDAASLKVVSQTGSTTSLPKTSASWAGEIALDVEWAHAIAPDANILLVEANSDSMTDLLAAVKYASSVSSVSVVSMSWGTSEFSTELNYNSYFTTPSGHQGITYVASSGDSSAVEWPAISTNVLSVGGTTTSVSSSGTISSETAWSYSGGGSSKYLAEANYATSIQSTGHSTSPDVSYDANPSTGFAVYDSLAYAGVSGWQTVGGTSAGAPQWAALVAIADQGRTINGLGTLDGATGTLPTLYSLASNSTTYSQDFNDITSGNNRVSSASTGYDLATGLGTPKAASLVSALAKSTTTSTGTVTSTGALASSGSTGTTTRRQPPSRWGWGRGARNDVTTASIVSPTPSARTVATVDHDTATEVVNNAIATASQTSVSGNGYGRFAGGNGSGAGNPADLASGQTRIATMFSSTPITERDDQGLMQRDDESVTDTNAGYATYRPSSDDVSTAIVKNVDLPAASKAAAKALKARETQESDTTEIAAVLATSIAVGVYVAHSQRRKQTARDAGE